MNREKKVTKILTKEEIPSLLKDEFDLDTRISMGLIESVSIESISVPENSEIDVRMLGPEEESGIKDEEGNDAHGKTKKCLRVEATVDAEGNPAPEGEGKFAFVLQHHRKDSDRYWKVTGEKV